MNATRCLILSLFVFSCGFSSSLRSEGAYIEPVNYPTIPAENVRVIDDSELKDMRYTRVALLEATGKGRMSSRVAIIDELKRKAGLMGANAIVMPHFELVYEGGHFAYPREVHAKTIAVRLLDD